jgi:hypothetical protein
MFEGRLSIEKLKTGKQGELNHTLKSADKRR